MSVSMINKLKSNIPLGISTGALIFAITISYNTGKLNTEMLKDIKANRIEIHKHVDDKVVHMPIAEKIKIFVPRVEIDQRLTSIEKTQEKILDLMLNK